MTMLRASLFDTTVSVAFLLLRLVFSSACTTR